jgi:hypothetical protein
MRCLPSYVGDIAFARITASTRRPYRPRGAGVARQVPLRKKRTMSQFRSVRRVVLAGSTTAGMLASVACFGALASVAPAAASTRAPMAACTSLTADGPSTAKVNETIHIRGNATPASACNGKIVRLQEYRDGQWHALNGHDHIRNGHYSIAISFKRVGSRTVRAYVAPNGPYSSSGTIKVTR